MNAVEHDDAMLMEQVTDGNPELAAIDGWVRESLGAIRLQHEMENEKEGDSL